MLLGLTSMSMKDVAKESRPNFNKINYHGIFMTYWFLTIYDFKFHGLFTVLTKAINFKIQVLCIIKTDSWYFHCIFMGFIFSWSRVL